MVFMKNLKLKKCTLPFVGEIRFCNIVKSKISAEFYVQFNVYNFLICCSIIIYQVSTRSSEW